ncbi:hypothetical protein B5F40_08050 [Gordonibacter sp. An230]|nr:hypothetical protein B5F40_08050 [Gordonibacter sp. An230]
MDAAQKAFPNSPASPCASIAIVARKHQALRAESASVATHGGCGSSGSQPESIIDKWSTAVETLERTPRPESLLLY